MAMRRVIALVPMMDQDKFFQPVKQEKSGHQRDHRGRGIEPLHLRQSENLRQDVEAHDAEEDAGGEGENKMHSAAELERKQPSGNSGAEGSKREQECGNARSPLASYSTFPSFPSLIIQERMPKASATPKRNVQNHA